MYLVELWKIIQTSHEVNYYNEQQITQRLTKLSQTPDMIDSETIKSVM